VYRELARRYTTTELNPKQIHEFGVNEVSRIRGAMLPVVARTGYKGSLDDFLKIARTERENRRQAWRTISRVLWTKYCRRR